MKPSTEFQRFDKLVSDLLSVPHDEIKRREAEYRKQVDANPHRPGPKRGSKRKRKGPTPSASDHEATET